MREYVKDTEALQGGISNHQKFAALTEGTEGSAWPDYASRWVVYWATVSEARLLSQASSGEGRGERLIVRVQGENGIVTR